MRSNRQVLICAAIAPTSRYARKRRSLCDAKSVGCVPHVYISIIAVRLCDTTSAAARLTEIVPRCVFPMHRYSICFSTRYKTSRNKNRPTARDVKVDGCSMDVTKALSVRIQRLYSTAENREDLDRLPWKRRTSGLVLDPRSGVRYRPGVVNIDPSEPAGTRYAGGSRDQLGWLPVGLGNAATKADRRRAPNDIQNIELE